MVATEKLLLKWWSERRNKYEYSGTNAGYFFDHLWIIYAGLFGLFIYLVILIIRALKKYIRSKDVRAEKSVLKQNLGEVLKDLRTKNKMTQEFVAETIGVSRQAVSKWESGECDPSTSNLIALAKLYRTTVEEILQNIKQ